MNVPADARNCPFCLNPVEPDDEKVRCPKCGVTHHADCWKANGRCSVYGCDGWAAWSDNIAQRIAPSAEDAVIVDDAVERNVEDVTRCIRCGAHVSPKHMLCGSCSRKAKKYWFEYCFGPGLLMFCALVGGIAWIVRAILT